MVSPSANEPLKGESAVSPAMHLPPNPNLPLPQHYQGEQPPSLLPAMGYGPSPCGCSGAAPYIYHQPESYHPFYQYQVPAEPVSAFHDNAYYPQQAPTALSPSGGEYPGISNANATISQLPNLGGVSSPAENTPNLGYGTQPQYLSPESYGNSSYPQMMDWQGGPGFSPYFGPRVPGYPAPAYPDDLLNPFGPGYPAAYPGPINSQGPVIQEAFNGEEGGPENLNGYLDREEQVSEAAEESAGDAEQTETRSNPQPSGKKNVKISGSSDIKNNRKKSSKTRSEASASKERQRTGKASGRRNPWINA